jgi:hypothetical protein
LRTARPSATTDPGLSNNSARAVSVNPSFCADFSNGGAGATRIRCAA